MKSLLQRIQKSLLPSSTTNVQILSDLHLEVGQQYASFSFPVTAPLLLLAGDIGRLIDYDEYLNFLAKQVSRFERVFLVLGNHEFFGSDYESGLDKARQLSKEPVLEEKLVLLHRSRWDDPKSSLTILGCTLWSSIPESALAVVESKVGDFKKIENRTTDDHNRLHLNEVGWLRDQVSQIRQERNARTILIVTHHAPCIEGTSRPEHANNPWTSAFATDLLNDTAWDGVKYWVFGHTHYTTRFTRRGIDLIANQRGYVFPGNSESIESNMTIGNAKAMGHQTQFNPSCTVYI